MLALMLATLKYQLICMGQHKLKFIKRASKSKSIQTMTFELKLHTMMEKEALQILALGLRLEIIPIANTPKGIHS